MIKKLVKKKQKNIMKITKQDCKNKHEINIDNYLMKKRISKENMLKINTQICPKKIDRNSKIL